MAVNPGEEFNIKATPGPALLRKLLYLATQANDSVLTGALTSPRHVGDRGSKTAREDTLLRIMTLTPQQWDAQIVTVGGVTMTNAEAQAARRRILENPDQYIGWAKERDLIRDGEEQEFIETARRITELKELERNGQLTAAQQQEMEDLQGSRLGRVFDQVTAQGHRDRVHGPEQSASARESAAPPAQADALFDRMTGDTSQQPPEVPEISSVDDPLFANAPSLKSGFRGRAEGDRAA